jgi:hypothetical protein
MLDIKPSAHDGRADVRFVWWSAERISMGRPLMEEPNSSAAMRAASTDPRPVALARGPFMSVMTPTLMAASEICECAGRATPAAMEKVRHKARGSLNMDMAKSSPSFNGFC